METSGQNTGEKNRVRKMKEGGWMGDKWKGGR